MNPSPGKKEKTISQNILRSWLGLRPRPCDVGFVLMGLGCLSLRDVRNHGNREGLGAFFVAQV